MDNVSKFLSKDHCSVIASAGCGKTELIAQAIKADSKSRVLVLTHTNAGVNALKQRLKKNGVAKNFTQVDTIASWCLRYVKSYPIMSDLQHPNPLGNEWNTIYRSANLLLKEKHILSVISSSYDSVYVDEYQDCISDQHEIIKTLAKILPCRIVGDPLQGIFDFAGANLPWKNVIEVTFPKIFKLNTPWRWINKNEELGNWLLKLREKIIYGESIVFGKSTPTRWRLAEETNKIDFARRMSETKDYVVAVLKWPKDAHQFARLTEGSFSSMEALDCRELNKFAECLDNSCSLMQENKGIEIAKNIIYLAKECMTEVNDALENVIGSLELNEIPDINKEKNNQDIVIAIANLVGTPNASNILAVMIKIEMIRNTGKFRNELWREAKRIVEHLKNNVYNSYADASWNLRNHRSYRRGSLDSKLVSRTLLIKGLEFDHSVIVDAEKFIDNRFSGGGGKDFYVAATRGTQSLSVISKCREIKFLPIPELQ